MSWAKFAIEKLKEGETVQIRPRGHSMKGKVMTVISSQFRPANRTNYRSVTSYWCELKAMITFISLNLSVTGDF